MLDPLRRRLRHLQLLERPGHPQVQRGLQASAAPARSLRVIIKRHIGPGPAHRRPRRPRLLPPPAVFRPLSGPPLLTRRPGGPEGHPRMGASTSSRCSGTGRLHMRDPLAQLRQLRPQLRDLLIPGSARHATRGRRRQPGHEPRSSRPRPPRSRNHASRPAQPVHHGTSAKCA